MRRGSTNALVKLKHSLFNGSDTLFVITEIRVGRFTVTAVQSLIYFVFLEDKDEGDYLRTYFGSTEALHICWNAKKHIKLQRVWLRSSKVDGHLFKFQYNNGNEERHVALKCPSQPIMYVYFGCSEKDIKVILVDKSLRKRPRKNANPHHHIPLNVAENGYILAMPPD